METEPKYLSKLPPTVTPSGLLEKVMGKIHAVRMKQLRVRLSIAVLGAVGTFYYAAYSWSAIWREIQQSSFIEFLRLATSDSDIALANAKELGLGLLESIPLETVIVTLVCAFALLVMAALVSSIRHERRFSFIHRLV